MPDTIGETIRHHEAAGEYDHPDFVAALEAFYKRHLCRLDPWPDALERSGKNLEAGGGHTVYNTINGPTEFTVTGELKDWDRIDRLGEITVPTLITVGRHDEITPACAEDHSPRHRRLRAWWSSRTARIAPTSRSPRRTWRPSARSWPKTTRREGDRDAADTWPLRVFQYHQAGRLRLARR